KAAGWGGSGRGGDEGAGWGGSGNRCLGGIEGGRAAAKVVVVVLRRWLPWCGEGGDGVAD
nr:hypothetical protein [Tanacetum cinerariifolium]